MSTGSGLALSCAIAIGGVTVLQFATTWGIGLSPDPVSYVSMARDFVHGRALGWSRDMAHFPPLYPALLALAGVASDPLRAARWVNSGLFAGNIVMAGALAWHASGGRTLAAPVASMLIGVSIALVKVHSQAWSEPLFVLFAFGGLAMLARHLAEPSPGRLLGATGLAALALLTRYAGLPLVATGVIVLACFQARPRASRFREAAVYALGAALPVSAWLLKNRIAAPSSRLADRELAFHPVTLAQLRAGIDTVASWVIAPGILPDALRVGALVAAAALTIRVWRRRSGEPEGCGRLLALPRLLGTFVVTYLTFLLWTITFGSADTPLDDRLLAPVYFAGVVGLVGSLARTAPPAGSGIAAALVALLALVTATNAIQTCAYVRESHEDGIGYASRRYVVSKLVDYVRRLPHQTVVVSNAARVLYIHTGRHVRSLPTKYNPSSLAVNQGFASDLAKLAAEAAKTSLVIVYFDRRRHAYIPTPDEIRAHVPLVPIKTIRHEGTVFRLEPANGSR